MQHLGTIEIPFLWFFLAWWILSTKKFKIGSADRKFSPWSNPVMIIRPLWSFLISTQVLTKEKDWKTETSRSSKWFHIRQSQAAHYDGTNHGYDLCLFDNKKLFGNLVVKIENDTGHNQSSQ